MITEPILSWLQEFCSDLYNNSATKINGSIKIDNVSNPGWIFDFIYENNSYNFDNQQDIAINLEDDHDWFFFKKKQNLLDASSGPLYLSTLLNIFIHYIKEMPFDMNLPFNEYREQLKKQNPLLA